MELEKHVKMLDFLIKHTDEKTIRETLVVSRNRLLRDMTAADAGMRRTYEWPCCAKCGKPYDWKATDNDYVHDVIPACECKAGVVFSDARPSGMWNEVKTEV